MLSWCQEPELLRKQIWNQFEGSFHRTGLSLFKNLQKSEECWTEEDQMEYLQARMEELAMKESEVNENGVVTIAQEKPQSEVQEPINESTP